MSPTPANNGVLIRMIYCCNLTGTVYDIISFNTQPYLARLPYHSNQIYIKSHHAGVHNYLNKITKISLRPKQFSEELFTQFPIGVYVKIYKKS